MSQTMIAGKNSIAQEMLEEFERELVTTRKFLERPPGDKLSWRPHAKSMSAGQLAYHIAETPALALRPALQDRAPADFGSRKEAATVGEVLALLDASAAYVRRMLPTLDDARMHELFVFELPNGPAIEVPRALFLRSGMLNHWYHHRGQFGVYLRLLGASVPSSYGPTADDPGTN